MVMKVAPEVKVRFKITGTLADVVRPPAK